MVNVEFMGSIEVTLVTSFLKHIIHAKISRLIYKEQLDIQLYFQLSTIIQIMQERPY